MHKKRVAIDIGGKYTSIFLQREGLVLKEPTLVLVKILKDGYDTVSFGKNAEAVRGRTNDLYQVVSPIKNGLVANVELLSRLIKYFFKKIQINQIYKNCEVVANIPCCCDEKEKVKFLDAFYGAGINNVSLVPTPIATALGGGKFIHTPLTYFIVDIGGTHTDIATINSSEIVKGCTLFLGGDEMDRAICNAVAETYTTEISVETARMIKEEIGSLYERDVQNIEVSGVDINSRSPKSIIVVADVIKDAICPFFERIAAVIKEMINGCTPNIATDINQNGVYFGGGVSKIAGLEQFMSSRLNLSVAILDECDKNAILGTSRLLQDASLLSNILKKF